MDCVNLRKSDFENDRTDREGDDEVEGDLGDEGGTVGTGDGECVGVDGKFGDDRSRGGRHRQTDRQTDRQTRHALNYLCLLKMSFRMSLRQLSSLS